MTPASDVDGSGALDRNRKGNVAEAAVVFHAARLGIQVFRPLLEHGRYDLVLEVGGRLQRVQCKWAQRVGDVVSVRLVGNRLTPAGYVRTKYQSGEIDAVAAYCGDLDRCYFLPSEIVVRRATVHLRLAATRNKQIARIHWASQYELSRLVAQPPEQDDRLSGAVVQAAATSLPSIPDDQMVVSSHDFRGRFGRYMEIAGRGTVVNITRHGRPLVRLVPALPSAPA